MADNLVQNVLIVDDEESILIYLLEFFHKNGYNYKIASDSSEALKILHEHSFERVFEWCQRPDCNYAQGISAGDAEAVRKEAHSIKSGAADLRASDLFKTAYRLEHMESQEI